MHVCVWKYGREVRGWDGKEETFDKVLKFPVVDIATALYSVYKTDAHFCPAVMYDTFGNPVSAQPRLKIESIEEIRKIGMDVKFTIIAIDVDAPNKEATDEWRAAEKEKVNASGVCSNAIIYYTSGGYRLLWSIPPTSIEQYEELLSRLRQTLERDGIVVDRLIDWSRCYRLPKVTK